MSHCDLETASHEEASHFWLPSEEIRKFGRDSHHAPAENRGWMTVSILMKVMCGSVVNPDTSLPDNIRSTQPGVDSVGGYRDPRDTTCHLGP